MEKPNEKLEKKFDRSVSLLTWCYNEEELISDFLFKALELMESVTDDFEIVVVNDGSTDKTAEILSAWIARDSRIQVIDHPQNLNVGYACRSAIFAAQKEFLFWQTVDWAYDLQHIRIFLELLKHYDVVQGIRPIPIRLLSYVPVLRSIYRLKSRSDNMQKAMISICNYYILRILFGVKIEDFQNVTFYPTALIQSQKLQACTSFINPEMIIKTYVKGARLIEVPIFFIPRKKGIAKGTRPLTVLRATIDTARNWFIWGWRVRLFINFRSRQPIDSVSRPFLLPEKILPLVIPLFKGYRQPEESDRD